MYSRHQNFCSRRIKVFEGHTIHGIEINPVNKNILLFGGNNLHILNSNFESILCKKVDDWVLEGRWSRDNCIAVVVMLNKLLILDHDLTVKHVEACPKKCIIYSAFIYETLQKLVIFSGTVFGEIVIWESPTNQVLATLTGHKVGSLTIIG